jgi:hypothetical protein
MINPIYIDALDSAHDLLEEIMESGDISLEGREIVEAAQWHIWHPEDLENYFLKDGSTCLGVFREDLEK